MSNSGPAEAGAVSTGARVLYFINSFDPGGAEHGLLTLIESGFFEGCDLHVLALCRGRGELMQRIEAALGPGRVQLVSAQAGLTVKAMLNGVAVLAGAMLRRRPRVVVLSLKQANIVGRFVLHFFPGVRCVSFEHIARYRARRAEKLYGVLLKALSWRVDEVWADCRDTLEQTRHYFLPRRRSENAVPLFKVQPGFAGKTDYAIGATLRLAGAGRLIDRKNFVALIDAVALLRAQGRAVSLDIYGDGPEMERLADSIAQHGLQGVVTMHGYARQWFVSACAADLFVNLSDTEGFCIVVAEALAAGLPVLATDVGGIREYGRDRDNMLKLPGAEPGLVAGQILALAADGALRARLGGQGRVDMLRDYSPEALRQCGQRILGGW